MHRRRGELKPIQIRRQQDHAQLQCRVLRDAWQAQYHCARATVRLVCYLSVGVIDPGWGSTLASELAVTQ